MNPQRDIGQSSLHGIWSRDVLDAPVIEEILGDVVAMLQGTVAVGHNVTFDLRFLGHEFERCGHTLPTIPHVCTMRLACARIPNLPNRRLETCCELLGIDLSEAHAATADTSATLELLRRLCEREGKSPGALIVELVGQPPRCRWPAIPPTGKVLTRERARELRKRGSSFITHLLARLPVEPILDKDLNPYFDLLERALEDRRISANESSALISLALDLDLTRGEVTTAHELFVARLIAVAQSDGIITAREEQDLHEVMEVLGIDGKRLPELRQRAERMEVRAEPKETLSGKSICFTGEFTCRIDGELPKRSYAEDLARGAGMTVKSGVSKKLDILVAADPDSLSGKARRARELGVRIISEPVFWQLMGKQVQ